MKSITPLQNSWMIRILIILAGIQNHSTRKKVSILWPKETSLCMIVFYLVDGRQRVFIQSLVMFSLLCQMTQDVERLQGSVFIRCPVKYTALFLQPLVIPRLGLRSFSCLLSVFQFITQGSSRIQNFRHILAEYLLKSHQAFLGIIEN